MIELLLYKKTLKLLISIPLKILFLKTGIDPNIFSNGYKKEVISSMGFMENH